MFWICLLASVNWKHFLSFMSKRVIKVFQGSHLLNNSNIILSSLLEGEWQAWPVLLHMEFICCGFSRTLMLCPWGTNTSVALQLREQQSDKQCRPNPGQVWGCVWYASLRYGMNSTLVSRSAWLDNHERLEGFPTSCCMLWRDVSYMTIWGIFLNENSFDLTWKVIQVLLVALINLLRYVETFNNSSPRSITCGTAMLKSNQPRACRLKLSH